MAATEVRKPIDALLNDMPMVMSLLMANDEQVKQAVKQIKKTGGREKKPVSREVYISLQERLYWLKKQESIQPIGYRALKARKDTLSNARWASTVLEMLEIHGVKSTAPLPVE